MVALINSDTGILLDHFHPLSLFHLPSLRTSQVGRPTVVLGSVAGRGIFNFLLPLNSNLFCSWFLWKKKLHRPAPAPVFFPARRYEAARPNRNVELCFWDSSLFVFVFLGGGLDCHGGALAVRVRLFALWLISTAAL